MTMSRLQIVTVALMVFTVDISQVSTLQSPVNLGTAANYVIFAKSGITSTGTTTINGNLGIRPAAATAITGFSLELSSFGTYSTSPIVVGKVYAADYALPTPTTLLTASSDMEAAYTEAANRENPDFLNHGAGNINGVTLTQGLYKFTSPVTVGGTVTLTGSSIDVFIFQVAGTLTFNSDANIVLNGVKPTNVFWVSAGAVTLGPGSSVKGIILGKTGISYNAGAKHTDGRALAQTAVTMISNTVSQPSSGVNIMNYWTFGSYYYNLLKINTQ